ncbi:MAG: protein kinase [Polyangiaceae bacterium]|jgi:serine/threonine-protein kinase
MGRVDADVVALVRAGRLLDAANLAKIRGRSRDASALFEQACSFQPAAEEALRGGDATRALDLAATAGDASTAERALAQIAVDPPLAERVAERLTRTGHHAWAARLLAATGRLVEAARSWERAGDALRAAAIFEAHGDVVSAVRVLEAAVGRHGAASGNAVALGALLTRLGRDEAAVRVLQRIPSRSPERREALGLLAHALQRLGLPYAAAEAADELALIGGLNRDAVLEPPIGPRETLFGRYEVVREIGSSASARVLECIDRVLGDRVAVKIFAMGASGTDAEPVVHFLRDVDTVRSLDHPSIVPTRKIIGRETAVVSAWMEGGSLEERLSQPMAPCRAVEIASTLLRAIGDAHRFGILHLAIKPTNVLFDSVGAARLTDFGTAWLVDVSATAGAEALAYASPETREGRSLTASSDLFAVGVMLHEMLTGQRPSVARGLRARPSERHSGLNAEHDGLIGRWTAEDPDRRPASAHDALDDLSKLRWPSSVDSRRTRSPAAPNSNDAVAASRFEPVSSGPDTFIDTWCGRFVERVALTERVLARARAFALADADTPGGALQAVLRVDPEGGAIWLARVRGSPLGRPLAAAERARLQQALDALHAHGIAHGHVDASHMAVDDEAGLVLRFAPDDHPTATAEDDDGALAAL